MLTPVSRKPLREALFVGAVVLGLALGGCRANLLSMSTAMPDAGALADAAMPATDAPLDPASFFATHVEGMLLRRCGGCHGAGRSAPDFLRPDPDVRTTLLSYPALIDLRSPRTSRLLVKGEHSGPAFSTAEAETVRTWIEAEAAAGTTVDPSARELATSPVAVREGFNMIPLDTLGMPASSIHFVASRVGGGVFLDSVQIAAGPMGARIEHPTFVTWVDGEPRPDPVDRFADLALTVEPNSTATFGSGTVVLTDHPTGALLSIHFTVAGPAMGGTTPMMPGRDAGAGPEPMRPEGCRELGAFRMRAVPPLRTYCTRCHAGGMPAATASMDMRGIDSTNDATALMGCNQVLGRIPPEAPSTSGLFVQPDPTAGGSHPFRFGTAGELNNFRTLILGWFEMEAR